MEEDLAAAVPGVGQVVAVGALVVADVQVMAIQGVVNQEEQELAGEDLHLCLVKK